MFRNFLSLIVSGVIGVIIITTGCSGMGNPIAPDPSAPKTPLPFPNQSGYSPTLPMSAPVYLKDAEGKNSAASIRFTKDFTPKRGSQLILGTGACPTNCFQQQAEICMDPIASLQGYNVVLFFSEDGITTRDQVGGGFVTPGTCQMIGDNRFMVFDWVPKWLLAIGEYTKGVKAQERFELDYQAPR